jgi:hypothetical protein
LFWHRHSLQAGLSSFASGFSAASLIAAVPRANKNKEYARCRYRLSDGMRGIALVDIEAIKDRDENIVGAVNCFQDITERRQAEERDKTLAREVDHRAKNLLTLVQATVHLTHADTVGGFKAAIEGRLQAFSNAHTLLAQSRWAGANLHTLITEELAPYNLKGIFAHKLAVLKFY